MDEPSIFRGSRNEDERGSVRNVFPHQALELVFTKHLYWLTAHNTLPGTVRGMHFQEAPSAERKLVAVLRGAILDVVIDLRFDSANYGSIAAFELSDEGCEVLYIPRGFAHGYQTLESSTLVSYAIDSEYAPSSSRVINPLASPLAEVWPLPVTSISAKDRGSESFANYTVRKNLLVHAKQKTRGVIE